jgi:hypothetical protein
MSRHPNLDHCDDRDPIELAADDFDRPTRSDLAFEPADFDDVRLAERFGVPAGGHFAHEANDDEMGEW